MTGLREIPGTHRRRAVWEAFALGGFERLTEGLMSGRAFTDDDLKDMQALRQRADAFGRALDAREKAEGVVE